jgi:plastocyanin
VRVKSPADVAEQSAHQVYMAIAKAYGLIGEAMSKVPGPVHNPDKTTSYTVLIGYAKDSADLMRFFPSKLTVHPGDTVNFMLSSTDDAPHTVTFLNGNPDLPLVVASPNPPNPPYLLINAQVLTPANPGVALNKTDLFNSGMLMPGGQSTYTLKIGNVSGSFVYQCILHDTSGMVGTLRVLSK